MAVQLKFAIDDQSSIAQLELRSDGKTVAKFKLSDELLEDFQQQISDLRSKSANSTIPKDIKPQDIKSILVHPKWRATLGQGKLDGHLIFSVRHPGYGWLSYALPPDEKQTLGAFCKSDLGLKPEA